MTTLETTLIIVFLMSVMANSLAFWYMRRVLPGFIYTSQNLEDLTTLVANYREHLRNIYGMEMYYGDETIKHLIKLHRSGQIASGEMASIAGIAGASVQTSGGQWFTDYGLLPLQDRKSLWLDGAHKINKDEMARLAEAERTGKIEINKASNGEAWARVRQGKIMNPMGEDTSDTTTMNNFIYPVQALLNSFQLQSIARIDVACFVVDNVSTKNRNIQMNEKHNPLLEDYEHLLKLIWSGNAQVHFTEDVIKSILEGATNLENMFKTDELPLITNDQKYKLAKLSASLAGFTASFNEDYTKIVVKEEHVDWIVQYLNKTYREIGLLEIKDKAEHGDIDVKSLYIILKTMIERAKIDDLEFQKPIDIIQWMAHNRKFIKDEIKDEFDLARDKQLMPLISFMSNENIIKKSRTGLIITKKGIAITKFINSIGKNIINELMDHHNKTFRNFRCDKCNTEWKHTSKTLQFIQKEHSCVLGGAIKDITDEDE